MNHQNWDKITFAEKLRRIEEQGRQNAQDGKTLADNPYTAEKRSIRVNGMTVTQIPEYHDAWLKGWRKFHKARAVKKAQPQGKVTVIPEIKRVPAKQAAFIVGKQVTA